MSDEDLVLIDVDDTGVATLTLNDPSRHNAWSVAMENRYFSLLDQCAADTDVRAVVLTGAGRMFCPGLALDTLGGLTGTTGIVAERRSQYTPRHFPKPIIGAINGACAGLGLIQALQCDVRFASSAAKFTTSYARRGMVAEHGLAWNLQRIVGTEYALDLLLSARVVLADEALRIGLVTRVAEPDAFLADAQAYARDLATNCSPAAMAAIRLQTYTDIEAHLDEATQRSYDTMQYFYGHPDMKEGVAAFNEKRSPRFPGVGADFDGETVIGPMRTLPPGPKARTS